MKAAIAARRANPILGREKAALTCGREVDEFFPKKAAEVSAQSRADGSVQDGEDAWVLLNEVRPLRP